MLRMQVETNTEKQPSKPEPCNSNNCAANILDRDVLVEWDGCCSCSRKAKCMTSQGVCSSVLYDVDVFVCPCAWPYTLDLPRFG